MPSSRSCLACSLDATKQKEREKKAFAFSNHSTYFSEYIIGDSPQIYVVPSFRRALTVRCRFHSTIRNFSLYFLIFLFPLTIFFMTDDFDGDEGINGLQLYRIGINDVLLRPGMIYIGVY